MDNSLVKIIIPIYQSKFSSYERFSFERSIALMKNYPIVIIKPKHLDVSSLLASYEEKFDIEEFDDHYFESIRGYNHLMLSSDFYSRFHDSRYILICQLDVYLFEDQLNDWCQKGYDYIGAPWLKKKKYNRWYNAYYWKIKKMLYQQLSIKSYHDIFDAVGNGGFSLRNVESALTTLKLAPDIVKEYRLKCGNKRFNEDVFWALEMPKILSSARMPTKEEAVRFAFDVQVQECYELNNKQLPFGAHGWQIRLKFYNKFIHFS